MDAKIPADIAVTFVSRVLKKFLRDADSYAGHELLRSLLWDTALTDWSALHQGRGMFWRGEKYDEEHADYVDEKGQVLIERAKNGDADADAVLCRIGAQFVLHGEEMPHHLRVYIFTVLMKLYDAPPPRRKGGDRYAKFGRNRFIVEMVSQLQEVGYRPTRNRATCAQRSGCSIVAEAFSRVGIAIDEAAIEKVWGRRSQFNIRS